jgi:chemotaxis protein MotB
MKISLYAMVSVAALAATTGCVSKGRYDDAVAQTKLTRAELAKQTTSLQQTAAERDQVQAEVARLKGILDQYAMSSDHHRTVSQTRISELQKRLSELQAAQAAVEARAALYRELSLKLKQQIDAGDLTVVLRDGRMVLQLPNDVLFDTGRTEIKPAGKRALEAIGAVMKSMPQRHFQVAGHTDNVPIHTARFASNWELSSGRALRVVHFLVEKGVEPGTLSAAGYAEIDPVAANDSVEGRRANRRTEVTLQPNIDELVKVPH